MAIKGDEFLAQSTKAGFPEQTVVFIGMQETGLAEIPAFPLFNLTKDIIGHVANSTLSRMTLIGYGFVLPKDAP